MRMTIAKPIQTLEYLRDSGVFPFDTKEGVLYTVESIDETIETMRKFQKIEQIINNAQDSDGAVKYNWLYEQIRQVLEDGNDD